MPFGSNVAPSRRVKERVEREPWTCKCLDFRREWKPGTPKLNHPGLKRCGTCGEPRP